MSCRRRDLSVRRRRPEDRTVRGFLPPGPGVRPGSEPSPTLRGGSSMRSFTRTAAMFLGLAVFAPLAAQDSGILAGTDPPRASAMADRDAIDRMLERPARLDVKGVALSDALELLRSRSNARIAFSPSLLPVEPPVNCACRDLTVGEALDILLAGSGFHWVPMSGQLVVEPAPRLSKDLQPVILFASTAMEGGPGAWSTSEFPAPALTGTIRGQVTHRTAGRPLTPVQVYVEGTSIGTVTAANGQYQLNNVPAGEVTVLADMIGFARATATVTVVSGQETTVDFQLTERALDLDGIVVTGTAGGTQRRAIGNVVATVNADDVISRSPVQNVDQLLGQRTPGMMLMPGTAQVGTGSAPRIRGIGSVTQGNDPIVYIDGVRMDSSPTRGPGQRGGSNISRLNDIHPSDIERIEVIKGPAAATLYGTEASNGVIQIITKRGESGAPQFDMTTRLGANWLWNPEGRTGFRYMPDPNNPGQLIGMNIYEEERVNGLGPVFGYGDMQSYNLSVRGGTDLVRYFGSISRDNNTGIVDWNWERRLALRANFEAMLSERLTAVVSTAFITGETRLSQGTIDTDPFSNLIWSNPRNLNDDRRGWRAAPPEEWSKYESRGDNDRTTTSLEVRFQPVSWMSHRLVAGIDNNAEKTFTLLPQQAEGANHFFGNAALGQKNMSRGTRRFVTLDYGGSANFSWQDYSFQPSVGLQYSNSQNAFVNASGSQFPAIPITTISGGAVRDGGESFSEESMVGFYVQQQVGWNNRVFVTGAVRMDSHSAFGTDASAAIYPKVSGTWVISEEDFWDFHWMDQFRLRAAFGAAGQQPGTFAATRVYNPRIGYRDLPALTPGAFGNPDLKPERGEELEMGFDASFLDGRIDVEVTRYQRATRDAIINRALPPSTGFTGSQVVNLGQIDAWGNELGVVARLIEGSRFSWELDTQFATMENRIESLGDLGVIFAGTQSQHREGYSVADMFMLRVLDVELDGNGNLLSAMCDGGTGPQGVDPGGSAVPCSEAPQVWLGKSQPTWQFGLGNSFTLFDNLRFYVRVEGNGGHLQNNTEIRATHNQNTTEAVLLRNNPMIQAYRALENDRVGVYEAGFLRLREISMSYDLPMGLVERVGARRASLSLGMRNVAMLWSAQHGWSTPRDGSVREALADMTVWDPEVRSTGSNAVGYQTVLPPAASATMTFRLSF
ncbi:MAG: SusC/RagA family TonB-linked outer membrane protein [Gemmatimonadales bacterium]|nr:MAG: SusC/RagA family TonB-linked outer membrane protein [Gemmatimonadales bacterium]